LALNKYFAFTSPIFSEIEVMYFKITDVTLYGGFMVLILSQIYTLIRNGFNIMGIVLCSFGLIKARSKPPLDYLLKNEFE
jgi:hypothetical protein